MTMMQPRRSLAIRDMKKSDWPTVSRIYSEGIQTGCATFEPEPPESWEDWVSGRIPEGCLVQEDDGHIIGWATMSTISSRCVYGGISEVSIYVSKNDQRKGIGTQLLKALIARSEKLDIWTLQAQMFLENHSSLNLHLRCGFREVGLREKIGLITFGKFKGQWKDNVLLERRSKTVGTSSTERGL